VTAVGVSRGSESSDQAGPRRPRHRTVVRGGRELLLNVVAVAVVGALLFPVYWAVCVAFELDPDPLITAPRLLPFHLIWSNAAQAINMESSDVLTSLIVSFSVVALGLLLGVPAAYALRRFRLRYTTIVVGVLLVTQMVPGISLSIAFYSMFHDVHLLNSYLGLILADSTYAVPLMVLLLRAFLESVPYELFESARVDGCNELRVLWSVIVPISVPGIVTASIFGFLGAWGDFVFGVTLNAGGDVQPVTLGLFKFVSVYTSSWGPIMATVVLAALPAAIVLAVGQRWIRGGLKAGALKA
jgi:multiple sugar transport system permease protein